MQLMKVLPSRYFFVSLYCKIVPLDKLCALILAQKRILQIS